MTDDQQVSGSSIVTLYPPENTVVINSKTAMKYKMYSFNAKGNIEVFANNTDSGESDRNELSHLKSALFTF